ncbi:hypothetical protein DSO57_1006677 [Entomophthora muscae]|uniref:Uncharacterized protein n=1 Tax=Entomophthora muscae TaxID=34485 RepID=A0ACC2TIN6_9FUNG|nr:hypothetical protein DSO57_1006677 [Entomophthora muscae]
MYLTYYFGVWLGLSSLLISYQTVIDFLGADPGYSRMIYLLQESRMIPLINRLTACTLLVLNNKELSKLDKIYPTHLEKERLVRYLLLKDNLTISEIHSQRTLSPLFETWLGLNGSLGTVDPLGPERGQMVKAQTQPGITTILNFNGVRVTKGDIKTDNGIIHEIDTYLPIPLGSIAILNERPNLSHFSKFLSLTPSLLTELKSPVPHSLFVWEDESVEAKFSSVEQSYLSHPNHTVAADDRRDLVAASFVLSTIEQPYVIYKQSLYPGGSMYSFNMAGDPVVITRAKHNPDVMIYNLIPAKDTDILTSDGVIHVLHAIPKHPIEFNAIKYIVGMDAARFATSLNSSTLASYLLSDEANCTVLVPSDFLLEPTAEITEILNYHILPGQHSGETLANQTLAPSFLSGELLNYNPQKIRVSIGAAGDIIFNGYSSVLGQPEKIGGVSLLRISHTLITPLSLLDTISHTHDLSMFYKLLEASGLGKFIASRHGITALLPTNSAFKPHTQALLYAFLLQPENIAVLQDFVCFCIMEPLKYSTDLSSKAPMSYPTLLENQNITLREKSMETDEPNWDVDLQITNYDNFVSTGVIHKSSGLLAPPNQASKLKGREFLKGHADIFLALIEKANLTHLFEKSGAIIAPIDAAWKNINLTQLERNAVLLKRTIQFHFLDQRLPKHLDLLSHTLHARTLSTELPNLRVAFSKYTKDPCLLLRIIDGPMTLSTWNATVHMSGQAHDVALALVDNILFLEKLPSNGPSFLIVLFATLLSFGGLGYGGYLAYFRYFPIQARGYSPIPEPQ